MSKIILNMKYLTELDISLASFLQLYILYFTEKTPLRSDIEELIDKNLVNKVSNKYIISPQVRRILMDSIVKDKEEVKETVVNVKSEIIERIDEYRNKWRDTGKAGAQGSRQSCIEKLTKWMQHNPDYTFDQILQAADLYITNEGSKNLKYLQRADYFIYKASKDGTVESRLSAYIDDIDVHAPDGWSTELI